MKTPNKTSEYLLLLRGNEWDKDLSPEEIQKIIGQAAEWFTRLAQEGKVKSGHPLQNEGKLVSGTQGRTVIDGPYAESKEAIGGYILLSVNDMEEAVEIARQQPFLECGVSIEIRPIAERCPLLQRAQAALAPAIA